MARHAKLERLYGRLNVVAIRAYAQGRLAQGRRVDNAMGYLERVAWREGCRAEWVGVFA